MSLPAMLAMMTGAPGGLPPLGELIKLPCAICLALDHDNPADALERGITAPAVAVTLAGGTLVCREHVRDALPLDVCHDLDTGQTDTDRARVMRSLAIIELGKVEAAHPGTIERLAEELTDDDEIPREVKQCGRPLHEYHAAHGWTEFPGDGAYYYQCHGSAPVVIEVRDRGDA